MCVAIEDQGDFMRLMISYLRLDILAGKCIYLNVAPVLVLLELPWAADESDGDWNFRVLAADLVGSFEDCSICCFDIGKSCTVHKAGHSRCG